MSDARALRERIADNMQEASERAGCAGENQFDACVDVALRLVMEERKESFGQHTLAQEWQGRAEAAERALAERGHVAGCYCEQTEGGGWNLDSRCAPLPGKDGAR